MKCINQSSNFTPRVFVWYFPRFLPKHFHVQSQKLRNGIFIDLASYDYFLTIQALKEKSHVPI